MDFKLVLEKLLTAFGAEGISYALIGGFAAGLWGVGKSTVDIDFLVNRGDMEKVDGIMQRLGYECRFRSENVSQYVSPLRIFGEVDFLHAFREASMDMLQRAEEKEVMGHLKIMVLKPEDLIGLKVQAIKNNPSRKQTETADIEALASAYKDTMDWQLVEGYFKIFEMNDLYEEIRRSILK